jgi:hypothetical protein
MGCRFDDGLAIRDTMLGLELDRKMLGWLPWVASLVEWNNVHTPACIHSDDGHESFRAINRYAWPCSY